MTCVSLGVFLATSEPQGGTAYPASHAWATGAWGTVGAAAVLTLLGIRGTTVRRTALVASATAMMWALVATLVKTMTDTLSVGSVAFAAMCGAVAVLTRTAPATMSSPSAPQTPSPSAPQTS